MKKNKDSLGDRMKAAEHCYRFMIPKKMYVVVRLDGCHFHSYTKGLDRPFDKGLMDDMDATTKYLCENVPNCKVGYVQSDEISLVLCDDATHETEPWFGNNIQKICSVAASMCTAKFNHLRMMRLWKSDSDEDRSISDIQEDTFDMKLAHFDSRVFIVPNSSEVLNYLHWRSQDATRNSISSVAQSLYSHKELHGVNSKQQQELIIQEGINWNDYSYREKRGGTFAKDIRAVNMDPSDGNKHGEKMIRHYWQAVETPMNWFDERETIGL